MDSESLKKLQFELAGSVADTLRTSAVGADTVLNGKQGKALLRSLREMIAAGDVAGAARSAATVVGSTRGEILTMVAFAELFRPTTFVEDRIVTLHQALRAVSGALEAHPELQDSSQRVRWWMNFVELFGLARDDERQMLGFIKRNATLSVTAFMTLAEVGFVDRRAPYWGPAKRAFEDLAPEDVASGASYALEAFARSTDLGAVNLGRFTNATPVSLFKPVAFRAYQLREILDAEADVFRAGYRCERELKGKRVEFEILPPTERHGMALGQGYWLSSVAPMARERRAIPVNAETLGALIDLWIRKLNPKFSSFEGKPGRRRLVMKLPKLALMLFGQRFLTPDELFAEEAAEVAEAARELQWPTDRLLDFELRPGLRVFDLLKIHRVLRLMASVRMTSIREEGVTTLDYWNSVVSGIEINALEEMLCAFGLPTVAVSEWLKLFVWDAASNKFLDLQYTPAIRVKEGVAVLSAVAACSNYVRNGLVQSHRRPWADDDEEMIALLKSAFDGSDALVWPNVDYSLGEEKGEVDCMVLLGETLFAMECKKSLLPCSAFERRTTVDCLVEAGVQLARFCKLWANEGERHKLAARLNCERLKTAQLRGCIVLSHRLLSGADWAGWPIRYIGELWNYIRSGEGRLTMGTLEVPLPMRAPGVATASDLERYLSHDVPHLSAVWASMHRTDEVMKLAKCTVRFPHYGLNLVRFLLEARIVPDDLRAEALRIAGVVDEQARMGRLEDQCDAQLQQSTSALLRSIEARLPRSAS